MSAKPNIAIIALLTVAFVVLVVSSKAAPAKRSKVYLASANKAAKTKRQSMENTDKRTHALSEKIDPGVLTRIGKVGKRMQEINDMGPQYSIYKETGDAEIVEPIDIVLINDDKNDGEHDDRIVDVSNDDDDDEVDENSRFNHLVEKLRSKLNKVDDSSSMDNLETINDDDDDDDAEQESLQSVINKIEADKKSDSSDDKSDEPTANRNIEVVDNDGDDGETGEEDVAVNKRESVGDSEAKITIPADPLNDIDQDDSPENSEQDNDHDSIRIIPVEIINDGDDDDDDDEDSDLNAQIQDVLKRERRGRVYGRLAYKNFYNSPQYHNFHRMYGYRGYGKRGDNSDTEDKSNEVELEIEVIPIDSIGGDLANDEMVENDDDYYDDDENDVLSNSNSKTMLRRGEPKIVVIEVPSGKMSNRLLADHPESESNSRRTKRELKKNKLQNRLSKLIDQLK